MIVSMVAADLTKRVSYQQAMVNRITVWNNNSASDRFIMLFDTAVGAATIANGSVPVVKAFYAPAETQAIWTFQSGIPMSELIIGISTTEASMTAPGAGAGVDMTLDVSTDHAATSTFAVVGDLTTSVASRQIWASASGGVRKLLRLNVVNLSVSDVMAVIQASNSINASDDQVYFRVPALTQVNKNFGRGGYKPFQKDANGTEHRGCTVRFVTMTGGLYADRPLSFIAATDFNVRAMIDQEV